MLIGQLMQGVMRNVVLNEKSSALKTLELRPGQVVKGTVLQTFGKNEAMLNIEGVKIRATLETPLTVGQTATLQVQNESTDMQILLKPLNIQNAVDETATRDLLKNLGLKETPANRMLAQQLLMSPVPLSKEQIQQIRQVAAAIPANVPQEEWNQAILVAHNKGLPMTEETVRALQQVLFGKSLHLAMNDLSRQLTELAGQKQLSPQAREKIAQLLNVLQQMKELSAQLTGQNATAIADSTSGKKADVAAPRATEGMAGMANRTAAPVSGNQTPTTAMPAVPVADRNGAAPTANSNASVHMPPTSTRDNAPLAAPGGQNVASSSRANPPTPLQPNVTTSNPMPINGAGLTTGPVTSNILSSANVQMPTNTISGTPMQNDTSATQNQVQNNQSIGMNSATVPLNVPGTQSTQTQGQNPAAVRNNSMSVNAPIVNNWTPTPTSGNMVSAGTYSVQTQEGERQVVQQMLRFMGVQTEHAMAQAVKQSNAESAVQAAKQTVQQLTAQLAQTVANTPTAANQANPLDSFKGTLMQLLSMAELPAQVKSSLDTLVQNITGQQLLLSPDKYGSFSYITMTIPLFDNQNQGQTADVYIQSRKGKKGQLDPKNCRLVFDLNMKAMGQTMVDVHVVDRIVNVYIMNDSPEIQQLIEESREEMAAGLESIGYQFLSLKVSDYPQHFDESKGGEEPEGAVKLPTSNNQNYRGVDYRV